MRKSGEANKWSQAVCDKAAKLFDAGKTNEAVHLIQYELIAKNRADYKAYAMIGDYYLLSKQYSKAEEVYEKGLKANPSEILFHLNLAQVYLFTDRLSKAKDIHKKYQNQSLSNGKSWKEQVKTDFNNFEKKGLPTNNFKKILRVLD